MGKAERKRGTPPRPIHSPTQEKGTPSPMDEEGEAPGAPTSPGAADGGGTSHRAGTAGALFPPPPHL